MAEKNNDRLLLKLPEELRARMQVLADKEQRSLSWMIRRAMEEMLAREGQVLIASGSVISKSLDIQGVFGNVVLPKERGDE